ncbi:aspartate/glutamate racemase family protein [Acinetobacter nectaris]|uniref:aspartate/glutamate racemase family protein n=1 Tax=Acinetobacter nectaris TaxID=1219382 RepID=UPI001F03167C|nr:amino acid racemase [Acinetobacter nectaris]MCF9047294.1 aspartate/glutamate racemase family protein [Acinetobacter nectaris]
MKPAIGILGGMGPQATVDTINKVIKNTPAHCDQEHIPTITVSIPDIPDRTESIFLQNNKPLEKMVAYLKILESTHVGCIIIPCNTAHFWFDDLQKNTSIKMISIIESTIEYLKNTHTKKVYILATSATIYTRMYQSKLEENHIEYEIPCEETQRKIMENIYNYKAGNQIQVKQDMNKLIQQYSTSQGEKFLLACTEIPLILEDIILKKPNSFIDATDILVQTAIQFYQNQ